VIVYQVINNAPSYLGSMFHIYVPNCSRPSLRSVSDKLTIETVLVNDKVISHKMCTKKSVAFVIAL